MGQTGGSVSAPCVSGLSPEGTITLLYLSQDTICVQAVTVLPPLDTPTPTASTTARLAAVLGQQCMCTHVGMLQRFCLVLVCF